MAQFRKKPIVIEAVQFLGIHSEGVPNVSDTHDWFDRAVYVPQLIGNVWIEGETLKINTIEGTMTATVNDYIIRGVNGELYPCKPDIFEKTYTKLQDIPAESPATPLGEGNNKLILRLKELMPYHINPYNLGEEGEISKIISQLSVEAMMGGKTLIEKIKAKYSSYISSIESHIRTNLPKEENLHKCAIQLDAYKEILRDLSTLEEYKATPVGFQLCPKCNGQGKVSKPPHIAGDVNSWVDSGARLYECNLCNGKMIIPLEATPISDPGSA